MTTHIIHLNPAPRGKTYAYWTEPATGREYLLACSRYPLLDAARELSDMGVARESDMIEATWLGTDHWALRSKVGVARELAVKEDDKVGPRFVKYTPSVLTKSLVDA